MSADKQALISEVLQLQQTIKDLTTKIETVRGERDGLTQENEVLVKYINNLMSQCGNVILSTSDNSNAANNASTTATTGGTSSVASTAANTLNVGKQKVLSSINRFFSRNN